jgi:AcrR family transcriptional regulator
MGIQERKDREKEARREEIINAAEKIFFERGLSTSTMDEVATVAELSKGTLYLYYRSKEDLYLAVTLRGMEVMYGLFEKSVSTGENALKLLLNLEEAYSAFFLNYRQYYQMMYFFENPDYHKQISESMIEQCSAVDRKIWELVSNTVRKAIDEGYLHVQLDPLEVGIMLWSNSNGFFRLIDRNQKHWQDTVGIDLEKTLRKSNALLLEAMMTERAMQDFPDLALYHGKAHRELDKVQRTQSKSAQ